MGLFLRYIALRVGPLTAIVYDSLIELVVINTGLLLKVCGSFYCDKIMSQERCYGNLHNNTTSAYNVQINSRSIQKNKYEQISDSDIWILPLKFF